MSYLAWWMLILAEMLMIGSNWLFSLEVAGSIDGKRSRRVANEVGR